MSDITIVMPGGELATVTMEQIQFDQSVTPGALPGVETTEQGSISINLADLRIYTKTHENVIKCIGGNYDLPIATMQNQLDNIVISDDIDAPLSGQFASSKAVYVALAAANDYTDTAIADRVDTAIVENLGEQLTTNMLAIGNLADKGISVVRWTQKLNLASPGDQTLLLGPDGTTATLSAMGMLRISAARDTGGASFVYNGSSGEWVNAGADVRHGSATAVTSLPSSDSIFIASDLAGDVYIACEWIYSDNPTLDLGIEVFGSGAGFAWDGITLTYEGNKVYHEGSKPTASDVGLGNVSNYAISDAVDADISTQYASSQAVKLAYDKAVETETTLAYLINDAPETLNTLKELADEILSNDVDITSILSDLSTKATQADLQGVADSVATLGDSHVQIHSDIRQELVNGLTAIATFGDPGITF